MSVLSDFLGRFRKKEPQYLVTNVPRYQYDFALIDSNNYLDQYEGWTYKATTLKADSITDYPPYLCKLVEGEIQEEYTRFNNDLMRDLYSFNPFMTYLEARKLLSLHLDLTGIGYWLITRASSPGYRYEFYPLDPNSIYLNTNELGLPSYYTFRDVKGGQHRIDPKELIVFRKTNPKNWLKGYGPLQGSRYQHNTLELGSKYNMNMLGNMGQPDSLIIYENAGDEETDRLREIWKETFGGVRNSGKTGVTNKKPEVVELGKTPKDLAWIEGMKYTRDTLLSIFGVPKMLVGLDDSTYANAKEALRIFQQYTIKPFLELETSVLNEQLIPIYYPVQKNKEEMAFKYKDPVESDKKLDAEVAQILYSNSLATKDESRNVVGLPSLGGEEGESFRTQNSTNTPKEDEEKSIKLHTKQRESLREYFDQQDSENEVMLEKTFAEYWNGQKNRLFEKSKSLTKATLKIGLDWNEENKIAIELVGPIMEIIARNYHQDANKLLDTDEPLSDETLRVVKQNIDQFIPEINAVTREKLVKIIAEGTQSGSSIEDLRKSITELYDSFLSDGRAKTIARTEITRAKAYVQRRAYLESKRVTALEWLSAKDADVRDAHRQADGQVRQRGSKFFVGGEWLAYPGDPSGRADNTINCRCTLLPVLRNS